MRLQLKLKVSWTLAGNVEKSTTVQSEPMWGSPSFVENGIRKMLVKLKCQREPWNDAEFSYFPLQLQIMKLPETFSLKNGTPSDGIDEGLINMSKRGRDLLTFKHVGNKYPLEYVMFCSFDYEKIPYKKHTQKSASEWCLYNNPSISFLIDGPTDGIDTEGAHWLYSEENLVEKFIVKMTNFGAAIAKNLNTYLDYDKKAGAKFRNEPDCCICGKEMGIEKGHIHHCHRTGRIFGRAHHDCNANYARRQNVLPVFVYCQNADDFHGILISLFHNRGLKISSPRNSKGRERGEQILLTLRDLPLVFINAHQFLPDSLQSLKDSIPETSFKRSNSISNFHKEPVPPAIETTFLLADTILFLRDRIIHKFELDICRYDSINEFVLDSILKMAGINLILPDQLKRTIRPLPETLKPKFFEFSEFSGTSPIVRALKSYLPFSNFKSLPKTEFSKFDSKFISKLLNKTSVGYIFQITVDQENGFFVHYILLKHLIKEKKLKFTIEEIIQFDQSPFMDPFVSAFLARTKFQMDRKLCQFFCKAIIDNTNMVKPLRINLKSVPVIEAANFHKLIQQENFVTANCFAENLVEVVLSEKYKWYEFTFLSLTLRDLIFTFSSKSKE